MDDSIEPLAKSLGCTIVNGRLFAPDGYHFKEISFGKTHEINMNQYSDAGIFHLLQVGVELCDAGSCIEFRDMSCKFWSDIHAIMEKQNPKLTDEQTKVVLETIKNLESEGYDGLHSIRCLPQIFQLLDVSITSLEEGARFSPAQYGLVISKTLKDAMNNFKIKK